MNVIKVLDLSDLAELCVELMRHGATYSVSKKGDGYWHIEISGF